MKWNHLEVVCSAYRGRPSDPRGPPDASVIVLLDERRAIGVIQSQLAVGKRSQDGFQRVGYSRDRRECEPIRIIPIL